MLDETAIEQRLAKLEQEVAALKQKSAAESASTNWLQNLIGSISDEDAFLQALKYGQEFRDSDKPVDEYDGSR
ncbi:transferase hexapeptide repeat containing protein [Cyanobacteria bacterium FACHB-63]|nr:transferase hexapeptide repeat containing protein [Cyanobacteria bacterium FACHB-63]